MSETRSQPYAVRSVASRGVPSGRGKDGNCIDAGFNIICSG